MELLAYGTPVVVALGGMLARHDRMRRGVLTRLIALSILLALTYLVTLSSASLDEGANIGAGVVLLMLAGANLALLAAAFESAIRLARRPRS